MLQRPVIDAVAEPRTMLPSRTVTVAPATAVPENQIVGLLFQPFSDRRADHRRRGACGAGAPPTWTVRAAENAETLRAKSVARAVYVSRAPSARP